MEKEVFASWNPTGLMERQGTSWKEAMEMKMTLELLIPGVEDAGKTMRSVQVSVREFCEGLGDRFEQELQ